ncbi:hypothetical protein KQI86_00070 [Clostridium sp. MSJ-11]|uniref:Lipoprotein n=1 Tax=Clostridium mobile TaxID=2841512 RepID=A0ABS6ED85_9CLOT|nr:hypothetical protein [Clostridium mobile]MBU5482696.1 hypothetical protein [Clostridium mobile]
MKKLLISILIIIPLISTIGCARKEVSNQNETKDYRSKTGVTVEVDEFKSDNFGFSLVFPESWKDKYRIVEDDTSVKVYFKPKEKVEDDIGMLFTIIKKTEELDETMYDSIYGCEKYYEINGITYFLGGTTDLGFYENHPEINTFLNMKSEISEILNTLKY